VEWGSFSSLKQQLKTLIKILLSLKKLKRSYKVKVGYATSFVNLPNDFVTENIIIVCRKK
jgi:hypothetical protein